MIDRLAFLITGSFQAGLDVLAHADLLGDTCLPKGSASSGEVTGAVAKDQLSPLFAGAFRHPSKHSRNVAFGGSVAASASAAKVQPELQFDNTVEAQAGFGVLKEVGFA